jgi:hypothetical protein
MVKTAIGLFDTMDEAHRAVQELIDHGYRSDDVSLMARQDGEYTSEPGAESVSGAAVGAGAGAAVGGVGGLLVGLASLAIPGIGPVVAAGPLATTLAGLGLGATAGGILGALTELGVPEETAHYYAEGVRRGGILVSVQTDQVMADRALQIMARHGAVNLGALGERWRQSGWTHFDPNTAPYQAVDPRPYVDPNTGPYRSSEQYASGARQTLPSEVVETGYMAKPGASLGQGERQQRVEEATSVDDRNYDLYEVDFRRHYASTLASRGDNYDRWAPGYRYGYDLASAHRYLGRDWATIEPEARRRWEARQQGTWEEFKEAVRYAWEVVTTGGKRDERH